MPQRAPIQEDEILCVRPIPDGSGDAVGWIGGGPCLVPGQSWPEVDGHPARFVAQIDLSSLPAAMWRGYGPRSGWLRLFLGADGAPCLLHSETPGTPVEGPAGPRRALGHAAAETQPAQPPAFDLGNPACRPVDLHSARSLIAALEAELDRGEAFLDDLAAQCSPRAADRPGSQGIWGRMLRASSPAQPLPPSLANPGILHTGRADIDRAREVLVRLSALLERAADPLPRDAVRLLCDALGHVTLPMFQTEAAPDLTAAPDAPAPIRVYQRNVPAAVTARAPHGMPQSDWAETWHRSLTRHALTLLTHTPDRLPAELHPLWTRALYHETDAMSLTLGEMGGTPEGVVAVLMRLPDRPLTGWDWGGATLTICLPLGALAVGDFSAAFALRTRAETDSQPQVLPIRQDQAQ